MAEISEKQDFIGKIAMAAALNPELKEALLKNPKEVMEAKLGFKLPDDFEINVIQDTPNKINIVIPFKSEELTEAELSAVSGGVCWEYCDACCP
jgi:hypothetical protein